jgi:sulfate permease, SulP family
MPAPKRSRPLTSPASIPADLIAGTVTALVLLPQAVAFAQLAGLPPSFGLAAGMLPPLVYAVLGSSRVMAVGPVSVAALMLGVALAPLPPAERPAAALMLAFAIGFILLVLGLMKLGSLVNFVSHPVLAGFTAGAALQIMGAQLPALLGTHSVAALAGVFTADAAMGPLLFGTLLLATMLLIKPFAGWLAHGQTRWRALPVLLPRLAPLLLVGLAAGFVYLNELTPESGFAVVGPVPPVLPMPGLIALGPGDPLQLLPAALAIALIAYLESIAIAKAMGTARSERIDPDRELLALGAANLIASVSGAMPVAGGLSRTVVNVAAGATSQRASMVTAVWMMLIGGALPGFLSGIPKAALAAVVISAALPLLHGMQLRKLWRYDRSDAVAAAATLAGVLLFGIEAGLGLGILLALVFFLWRSSRPHIAILGRVPGSQVFRNVERHQVEVFPGLLLVRVDEGLTFANADFVQQYVSDALLHHGGTRTLVLVCSAVNHIDASGLEMLEGLQAALRARGVALVLTDVKGPVQDRLQRVDDSNAHGFTIHPSLEAALRLLVPAMPEFGDSLPDPALSSSPCTHSPDSSATSPTSPSPGSCSGTSPRS